MKEAFENIALEDNKAEERFEMKVDGTPSILEYKIKGNDIYLTHTEVPQSLEGRGVAAAAGAGTITARARGAPDRAELARPLAVERQRCR